MISMSRILVLAWLVAVAGPRQQTEAPADAPGPTPAQIHVSHVTTAINGTPGGVGLLTILTEEAEIAARHAGLAVKDPTNLESIQQHVHHVRHAIDPTSEAKGPGKGYGVLRAAEGVETHIRLAARSSGATPAIQQHSVHVAACASNVETWAKEILAESEKVSKAKTAEEAAPAAARIQELTRWILDGVDANKDGTIAPQPGEGGIAQAKQHVELITASESETSSTGR